MANLRVIVYINPLTTVTTIIMAVCSNKAFISFYYYVNTTHTRVTVTNIYEGRTEKNNEQRYK